MQLAIADLDRHLARPLAPLYVVHGDAPLLVIEAADAIRAAARQQGLLERELLVSGQGFRWQELPAALAERSLFGEAKLIDLRIPTGKPGREGGDVLQRFAALQADGVVTLITLPEMDFRSRATAWFKALQQHGQVVEANAPPLAALPAWIAARLARQQQSTSTEALQFIAHHVEGNLLAAHQEILKLGLLHPAGELDLAAVRDAVLDVARFDLDMLRDSLLAGDPARCLRVLRGLLAEGAAAPLLLWLISQTARTLAQLADSRARGLPLAAAFKQARVFGPQQRAFEAALGRLGRPALLAAVQHAARADRIVKGLLRGNIGDELERLALRLMPQP